MSLMCSHTHKNPNSFLIWVYRVILIYHNCAHKITVSITFYLRIEVVTQEQKNTINILFCPRASSPLEQILSHQETFGTESAAGFLSIYQTSIYFYTTGIHLPLQVIQFEQGTFTLWWASSLNVCFFHSENSNIVFSYGESDMYYLTIDFTPKPTTTGKNVTFIQVIRI